MKEAVSCRGKKERAVDRRERGNHMEEPTCENRPTSMHSCVISHTASVRTNPVLCRRFTEVIRFYTEGGFFIQPFSPHNSKFYASRASKPSLTDVKSLLFQAVNFFRKTVDFFFFLTVHIQTYTRIQIYRTDREEERGKGRGSEADIWPSCLQKSNWNSSETAVAITQKQEETKWS